MAHAACLKKQPARTSPIRSPTSRNLNKSNDHDHGLKDALHKLDAKWQRCRPYVERINGTIVPLEHQGLGQQQQQYGRMAKV